jgi:hypothetical protein
MLDVGGSCANLLIFLLISFYLFFFFRLILGTIGINKLFESVENFI